MIARVPDERAWIECGNMDNLNYVRSVHCMNDVSCRRHKDMLTRNH